jgi:hypothetical protein
VFDLGRELAERSNFIWPVAASKGKGGNFADFLKTYNPKFVRVNEPYRPESWKDAWKVGIIAPEVKSPGVILNCVIVSRGDVSAGSSISGSGVFANGHVKSKGEILRCLIISDGDVVAALTIRDTMIIARGNIEFGHARDATLIAGGKVIPPPHYPAGAEKSLNVNIQENVTKPLGFITFFELSTVGVEVTVADKAVKVAAIEKGKPFDHAGVWVGDIIAEVNGKKPNSAESLRRLLRDALAIDDATVKLQRRDKTETVKVSLPE